MSLYDSMKRKIAGNDGTHHGSEPHLLEKHSLNEPYPNNRYDK